VIAAIAGERVAIVDSATATASRLAELLSVNGLEAPGTSRGTAADAGRDGHERPEGTLAAATHVQLTTGDVDAFRSVSQRLFGDDFTEIQSVELREAVA
jgi:hypothetical protein